MAFSLKSNKAKNCDYNSMSCYSGIIGQYSKKEQEEKKNSYFGMENILHILKMKIFN